MCIYSILLSYSKCYSISCYVTKPVLLYYYYYFYNNNNYYLLILFIITIIITLLGRSGEVRRRGPGVGIDVPGVYICIYM